MSKYPVITPGKVFVCLVCGTVHDSPLARQDALTCYQGHFYGFSNMTYRKRPKGPEFNPGKN